MAQADHGVPVACTPPSRTPSWSTPRKTSENISTLSVTSTGEKRAPAAGAARLNGSARRPSAKVTMPSGTLMAKSHGHDATDKIAAATEGPATDEVATTSELMAMPRPSCAEGNVSRTSAALTLMIPAAPSPCSARDAISVASELAKVAASDDTVNTAMPTRYTRR
ncbi:hypothetical protein FQZ97_828910 [compost metagenome]